MHYYKKIASVIGIENTNYIANNDNNNRVGSRVISQSICMNHQGCQNHFITEQIMIAVHVCGPCTSTQILIGSRVFTQSQHMTTTNIHLKMINDVRDVRYSPMV